MQILPNVYLINGFPWRQTQNGYLIRSGKEMAIVDSGDLGTDTLDLVRANCAAWGIRLEQVTYLLLTHAHYDHSSHAARLQSLGVKIVTNQDGAEAIASGDDRCIGYAVHRPFDPCRADRVIRDGEEIALGEARIRCTEAPGHANSCVIYEVILEGRRLWFTGDVIANGPACQSAEPGWAGGPDYHRPTYLETLSRLRRMECDCLFPGHGPPCLADGRRQVEAVYTNALINWR
ncbi:MAG: MBL fold metallo-hydrolase [Armatimonadetes bacterium]|nr:MBL fold metallo-hydrolase [Armatimonadota bacterium]